MAEGRYVEEEHAYYWGGRRLPSVTEILQDVGILDTTFYRGEPDKGTNVHLALHFLDEDRLRESSVDERIAGHVEAYRRFKRETGFRPQVIERPFYDPEAGFAGRPDRIGILFGVRTLLDFKSGNPEPFHGAQLAGYEMLATKAGVIVFANYGLYLRANGTYRLKKYGRDEGRRNFAAALTIYHFKREHGYGREEAGSRAAEGADDA